ncbi:NEB1-like protein [Mya arenaria]|uniref:NEB1-like protein n=1 Tax=Mya arenaria TaxID=6604 RepID=A0ABY7ENW6_MYAAR|nr:NEB1-like protein [Mya arenaria]
MKYVQGIFVIGREKDPSKSEVARLIQQSLELDRRRDQLRKHEQEKLQQLHDQFKPRDEVLEHEHVQRLHSESVSSREDDNVDLDESSGEEDERVGEEMEDAEVSEEFQAGEATPLSMPSEGVTDLATPSPEICPDMEPQALFIKLKEAQARIAELEAELARLKGRLIVLEGADAGKKAGDRKNEEMATRLRDVEKSLHTARKEINHYQIFELEGEVREAHREAGLPIPPQKQRHESPVQPSTSATPPTRDSGMRPLHDHDEISSESESVSSSTEPPSPAVEVAVVAETGPVFKSAPPKVAPIAADDETVTPKQAPVFESVPQTRLLDTSVNKSKAQLAANSPRRPPTKRPKSVDSEELIQAAIDSRQESRVVDTWVANDSENTVRKSDHRRRRGDAKEDAPQGTVPPPVVSAPTPPPPPSDHSDTGENSESSDVPRERLSSESSSTISQTSYDPSRPNFAGRDSEIPGLDTISTTTSGTADTSASDNSSSAKKSKGILPRLPFKFGSGGDRDKGGGVTLISARGINSEDSPVPEGGITLISKRKLDTGTDFDGVSLASDTSSGYMVGETESTTSYTVAAPPAGQAMGGSLGAGMNTFSTGGINEWTEDHVRHWLMGVEMELYADTFRNHGVTGPQLLALDNNKLKAMGIVNSRDRDMLKKKVKELKIAMEKERKQQERERKQMEKEAKAREKEQKKLMAKKK